jgi:hypothetical protein
MLARLGALVVVGFVVVGLVVAGLVAVACGSKHDGLVAPDGGVLSVVEGASAAEMARCGTMAVTPGPSDWSAAVAADGRFMTCCFDTPCGGCCPPNRRWYQCDCPEGATEWTCSPGHYDGPPCAPGDAGAAGDGGPADAGAD